MECFRRAASRVKRPRPDSAQVSRSRTRKQTNDVATTTLDDTPSSTSLYNNAKILEEVRALCSELCACSAGQWTMLDADRESAINRFEPSQGI